MPGIGSDGDYSAKEMADYLAENPLASGDEILSYLQENGFELTKTGGAPEEAPLSLGGPEGLEAPEDAGPIEEGPPEEGGQPHLTIVELRQKAAENAFKGKDKEEPEEEEVG